MKRQLTLSIVVTLSVLLSLVSFPSTVQGQQSQRFSADSGVVTLGAGQVLRLTVAGTGGNDTIRVRFRWARYAPAGCNSDGVCRQTLISQGTTPLETLGSADAIHYDQGDPSGIRVAVESNSQNVRVVFQIIDTSTGDIIAIWVPQGSPAVGK
jgi:hypothetical protein